MAEAAGSLSPDVGPDDLGVASCEPVHAGASSKHAVTAVAAPLRKGRRADIGPSLKPLPILAAPCAVMPRYRGAISYPPQTRTNHAVSGRGPTSSPGRTGLARIRDRRPGSP